MGCGRFTRLLVGSIRIFGRWSATASLIALGSTGCNSQIQVSASGLLSDHGQSSSDNQLNVSPSGLSYSPSAVTLTLGAETKLIPLLTGAGKPSRYKIEPDLPTGFSLDTNTGWITGKVDSNLVGKVLNFTVTASNSFGESNHAQITLSMKGIHYYLSPTGNNLNDGRSPSKPVQSIAAAVKLAKSGDIIELLPGIYRDVVDGNALPAGLLNGVLMIGTPGKSVISGLDVVTRDRWTPVIGHSNWIQISGVNPVGASQFPRIFLNGSEATIAKYSVGRAYDPKNLIQTPTYIADSVIISGSQSGMDNLSQNRTYLTGTLKYSELPALSDWTNAALITSGLPLWQNRAGSITSSSPGQIGFKILEMGETSGERTSYGPCAGCRFGLMNSKDFLNQDGTFVYDPNAKTLTVQVPPDFISNANSMIEVGSDRFLLADFRYVNKAAGSCLTPNTAVGFKMQNIDFVNGTLVMGACAESIQLDHLSVRSPSGEMLIEDPINGSLVSDIPYVHGLNWITYRAGVVLSGYAPKLTNSTVTDSAASCVVLQDTTGAEVSDNTLRRCGTQGGESAGVQFFINIDSAQVLRNTIDLTPRAAIITQRGKNSLISGNKITHFSQTFSDTGAIYQYHGRDPEPALNSKIADNDTEFDGTSYAFDRSLGQKSSLLIAAVYLDNGTSGMTVSGNYSHGIVAPGNVGIQFNLSAVGNSFTTNRFEGIETSFGCWMPDKDASNPITFAKDVTIQGNYFSSSKVIWAVPSGVSTPPTGVTVRENLYGDNSLAPSAPVSRLAFAGTSILAGNSSQPKYWYPNGANVAGAIDPVTFQSYGTALGGQLAFQIMASLNGRARLSASTAVGGSGISAATGGNPQSSLLEWQLPRLLANSPTHVMINTGTNELNNGATLAASQLTRMKSDLISVVDALQRNKSRVLLMEVPPISLAAAKSGAQANVIQWNSTLADICKQMGCRLVPLYRYFADDSGNYRMDLSTDGVHPGGTAIASPTDLMVGSILDEFGSPNTYASTSHIGSTLAAETDNLVDHGEFNWDSGFPLQGIVSPWTGSQGVVSSIHVGAEISFTPWDIFSSPSASSHVGVQMNFNQTNRQAYAQFSLPVRSDERALLMKTGQRLIFGGWFSIPAASSDIDVRLLLNDSTWENSIEIGLVGKAMASRKGGPFFISQEVVVPSSTQPSIGTGPAITSVIVQVGKTGGGATAPLNSGKISVQDLFLMPVDHF